MKFRAKLIWIATDLETTIEINADNATEALKRIQKIRLNNGKEPFYVPNNKNEFRSAMKIPNVNWQFGPASNLAPYVKALEIVKSKSTKVNAL